MMREYKELIVFGIFIMLAITACFLFSYWQVDISQHQWCTVLSTLTSHPVPKPVDPSANPSRVEAYSLYEEFVQIKDGFRCG